MSSTERELAEVEVRPAHAPDGRLNVLLQLPHGFLLLNPDDARNLAFTLTEVAEIVDGAST